MPGGRVSPVRGVSPTRKKRGDGVSAGSQDASDSDARGLDEIDGLSRPLGAMTARGDPAPPRLHRRVRLHEPILVEDFAQEALVACIKRSCGVASSVPMRRHAAPVTARVVGDPVSRSRAILLRAGTGKRDVAILWVSARDGILCSCFAGTQNAMFLSASARSSKCSHSVAFTKALSTSGVDPKTFRSRMSLRADAADFTVAQEYDSAVVWAVLYHSVFSVVSFSAANAALCVAPVCRRFRARCGHVRVVRSKHGRDMFNNPLHGSSMKAVNARKEAQRPLPVRERARVLNNEEEDEGVEKLPSDTLRDPHDADVATLCARTKRNLLPCTGEVGQGELWNRTADWRTLFMRRNAGPAAGKAAALKQFARVYSSMVQTGGVRDLRHPLVEPFCGSCGRQRQEHHNVEKERAVL